MFASFVFMIDSSRYVTRSVIMIEIDADSAAMMKKYLARYGFPPVLVRIPKVERSFPEVDFSALFPEVRR